MIRVLLVDDERLVCAHLRTILEAAPDIDVVAEAYDGAEAVEAVLRYRPDLVLMDLRMPGVDGLTAIEQIGRLNLRSTVVRAHHVRSRRVRAAGDARGCGRLPAQGHRAG
jgi:YesN/AraC family two-component response regulator